MAGRFAVASARLIHRDVLVVAMAAVLVMTSAIGVGAQTLTEPNPRAKAPPAKAATTSQPGRQLKNCSAYGPGFMSMPGTDMCIKIGGGVTVEAGH